MTAIFQSVVIGFGGKEYTITPTMALLNRIEQHVSLAAVAQQLAKGDPRLSHIATVAALMLQSAGAKASAEDVYAELVHGNHELSRTIGDAIMVAVFPARPGNVEAPVEPAKKAKTRK